MLFMNEWIKMKFNWRQAENNNKVTYYTEQTMELADDKRQEL